MNLTGKVAIVTASTSGIGFAIAKQYVKEGCNVVVSSRNQENVDRALKELEPLAQEAKSQVFGLLCDVLRLEDLQRLVEKTIEKFGKLDVLVAHTASKHYYQLQVVEASEQDWDTAFDENVKPARQLARLALPHMREHGGSIIFVAHLAVYCFPEALGLYSVAKATLVASMKAIANQVGEYNIRVNCITPGVIDTKFSEVMHGDSQWSDRIIENTAMHRFGDASEVAGAAVFLASDYSRFVSGESLVVAGGATVSHF